MEFSVWRPRAKTKFDFLGFEFQWGMTWSRKTDLKASDIKKQTQSCNSESQSLVSETLWFAEEDTV